MTRPFDGIVLIATKCTRADSNDDWARWYSDFTATLVGDSIAAASTWSIGEPIDGRPGLGHSHLTRLDLIGEVTVAAAEVDALLRERRNRGEVHPDHAEVRRDTWVAHGPPVAALGPEVAPTAMILAEVLCTDPGREEEWDTWYDEEHLPDMLGCGAFISGSRWRRQPIRPGGANHLTLYEIAGIELEDAIERSAAIMPGLVAAGRKHECHTGGLTLALRRVR